MAFNLTENQLNATINNLSLARVNVAAAQSQIADVDFAEESMNLSLINSLGKAGTYAVAQLGKINRQKVTDLLQG